MMSVSPPVIERVIACRYPVIDPERFADARKRWQAEIGGLGFESKVVKNWNINIPPDPQTQGPDLAHASLLLNEGYLYQRADNAVLRPQPDLFSVNVRGAVETNFEKTEQLALQFIPQWLNTAEIGMPSSVGLVYVDQFTDAHFIPFVASDGILNLSEVFRSPFFSPMQGATFVPPLHQRYSWMLPKSPRAGLSIQLDFPLPEKAKQLCAKLMTTTTWRLADEDDFSLERFKEIVQRLHHMHTASFQKMLTPAMLEHCGITQVSAEEATE